MVNPGGPVCGGRGGRPADCGGCEECAGACGTFSTVSLRDSAGSCLTRGWICCDALDALLPLRLVDFELLRSGDMGGLAEGVGGGGPESESKFIIDIGLEERGGLSVLVECECARLLRPG